MENDVTPDSSLETGSEDELSVQPQLPDPAPGSKTPSENLLAALKQEREEKAVLALKLKAAEEALQQDRPTDDEAWSDEGKVILEKHLKPLSDEVKTLTEQLALKDLILTHPSLVDKQAEFLEYRKSRPGYSLEDAATLFLSSQGNPSRRKGLEDPRGGVHPAAPTTMTTAEIDELREKNYPRYQKLLMEGKIPLAGNQS